ncbi:MAG TPA: SDR family oxidoreductase [Trueperaceae bacterium]|nr:SDR family oxidoreductase [Trueperaceae bacterium]
MDLQIVKKTALVTGASKGIGFAVAKSLAAEGVRVIMSARNQANLSKAVEDIRMVGFEAFGIAADVSQAAEIDELFKLTKQGFGEPDILVINAGGPPKARAQDLDDNLTKQAYELTLMPHIRLANKAIPAMKERGWGRIINITSISVKEPVANLALSNSFRAAVTGFAKTLATEIAQYGITVNNVAPGYTATERLMDLFSDKKALADFSQTIPAKRLATPEEVAAAAVFLASKQAAYITAQTILVDGGMAKGLF